MASLVVANNLHGDFLPVTPHLFIGVKGDLTLSNVLVIVLSVTSQAILLTTAHLSGQRATVEVNLAWSVKLLTAEGPESGGQPRCGQPIRLAPV